MYICRRLTCREYHNIWTMRLKPTKFIICKLILKRTITINFAFQQWKSSVLIKLVLSSFEFKFELKYHIRTDLSFPQTINLSSFHAQSILVIRFVCAFGKYWQIEFNFFKYEWLKKLKLSPESIPNLVLL